MEEKYKYMVATRCMTYNHAPYIEETLHGFAIQETTFPVVYLVVDDASSDGTSIIIKEWVNNNLVIDDKVYSRKEMPYGQLIVAPLIKKPNSLFVFIMLAENHYQTGKGSKRLDYIAEWHNNAKYIAFCEGDDYWTDSHKLQKQVDFLEGHPDYSFSCTGFDFLNQSTNGILSGGDVINANVSIINANSDIRLAILDDTLFRIQPVTVVYRLSSYKRITPFLEKQKGLFLMGDTQTWVYLLQIGKLHYLPDITAVYRLYEGSACRQKMMKNRMRFDLSCAEMRVYMADEIDAPRKYKIKFQKDYQKKLNIYYCYEKDYKPFIEIKFNSMKDRIQYYILKSFIVRPFFKIIYEKHYHKLLMTNQSS